MKIRIISGIIGFFLLIIILFFSFYYPFIINISLMFITFKAVNEIINIKNIKNKVVLYSSEIFSITRNQFGPGIRWQTCLYIYTLVIFICVMVKFIKQKKYPKKKNKKKPDPILNICFVYVLTIIISVCLGKLVEIRKMNINNNLIGVFLIFLTLGVAWACDIGAYSIGKFFGKNKLCPVVSPNKTVEGAIAGTFSSLVFSLFLSFIFEFFFKINGINYINLIVFSILGAPVSILGDLCFSMVKRTSNIKDFSGAIPGHGGILDRFDSVIFIIPYAYIYMHLVPIINFI